MWARNVETMLGFWLVLSPFIFHDESSTYATRSVGAGALVIVFSLLSYRGKWKRSHLGNLAIVTWLLGAGYLGQAPLSPSMQNHVMLGWLLAMLAILPSHSSRPPVAWQRKLEAGE